MRITRRTMRGDRAVLDGLATNAQIAEELQSDITEHRKLEGFLESRPWPSWAHCLLGKFILRMANGAGCWLADSAICSCNPSS